MKNTGLMILNNIVPCSCACRYCLLRSCKKADGVEYGRGKEIAVRFSTWREEKGLDDFSLCYAIGHCADYPELVDNITFNKSINYFGAKFLQINGIGFMSHADLNAFIEKAKNAGISNVDTTFYGLEEYHDRFSARKGDYNFMIDVAKMVQSQGLTLQVTIPIFEANKGQISGLLALLKSHLGYNTEIYGFIHDYRGNGGNLESIRLTEQSYENLPIEVKSIINISRYKAEAKWLDDCSFANITMRYLRLALFQDNIHMLEKMTCDEIINYLISLDEEYYSVIPSIAVLAKMYGDKENPRLYRQRDLYWKWQKQYIKENHLLLHDVTEEHKCGSFRS